MTNTQLSITISHDLPSERTRVAALPKKEMGMPLSIRDCELIAGLMKGDMRRGMSALELCKVLKKPPGTLSPRIARLEHFGYIEGRWHGHDWPSGRASIDPPEPSRSARRRYYRPTPKGRQARAETLQRQRKVSTRQLPGEAPGTT